MIDIKLINKDTAGEVLLIGRLDSSTAADTDKILMELSERFEVLTLNFAELEYISSAGLRTLKRLHVAMSKKGGSLELKNVNKTVMEVFEMTGFVSLLKFV